MHREGNFKAVSASFFRRNMFVQYRAPWDVGSDCVVAVVLVIIIIISLFLIFVVVVVVVILWKHLIGLSKSVTFKKIEATETVQAPLSSVHDEWDGPSWSDHWGYIFQPRFSPSSEGWVLQKIDQSKPLWQGFLTWKKASSRPVNSVQVCFMVPEQHNTALASGLRGSISSVWILIWCSYHRQSS